ncbi:AGE family epimerase/isomerase [Microvirga alba]|uniref:N-acylglucosamine 2-epimerase n=1 Tax=Microvirga alba TaxID=2791025 RepID=A0A931FSA5_9HYPH|nr:hypothetical protein [Microvirga alba]MBF9235388.1 hypothetical protein [Microvirga alba]
MSDQASFLKGASDRYVAANAATLRWMLARPGLHGPFLDTKVSSLTLTDYTNRDGLRGPDYTYGWIQGRGLEALASHAAFFANQDAPLATALDNRGRRLYDALLALKRRDGHAYFCYDRALQPIVADASGSVRHQDAAPTIFTYSDAFVAKGLIAGAVRYAPQDLPLHLDYFMQVIAAIESGRFQMDERCPLSEEAAAAQPDDFGPRMILLGAAGLLHRLGLSEHTNYADRFIAHVLEHHFEPSSGLLRNVPGDDACNVGHALEFVGFAYDHTQEDGSSDLLARLETILIASFDRGFVGPGLALAVSMTTGAPLNPYCPWWSLPETIRAASLCHARTGSDEALRIWRDADEAFFQHYWRGAIAYQALTCDGPVDYVPATPDLDPGYHTGLSLLAAIGAANRTLTSLLPQAAG